MHGIGGILQKEFFIGPEANIKTLFVTTLIRYSTLASLFLFVGVYHLFIYYVNRREKAYFHFSVLSILFGIYTISFRSIGFWIHENYWINSSLLILSITLYPYFLLQFFFKYFRLQINRVIKTILYCSLFSSLLFCASLFDPKLYSIYLLTFFQAYIIFVIAVSMYAQFISFNGFLRKKIGSRIILVGFFVCNVGLLNNFIGYLFPNTLPYLAEELFIPLIVSMAVSLGYKYSITNEQLRKISKQLRASQLQLKKANRIKDEFLASTSHELRTPLHGITGIARSILDGATGNIAESTRKQIELLAESAERLTDLVQNLLDFSKLKNSDLKLKLMAVDLRNAVNICCETSASLINEKSITITNEIPHDFPLIFADENRLQQILLNLQGNAIKFTPQGNIKWEATLQSIKSSQSNSKPMAEITITDTGIGINPENLETIFEPFEQLADSRLQPQSGTGLGLSITKKLIEEHGGIIRVNSMPGSGSRFTFTLPLAQIDIEEANITTSSGTNQLYLDDEDDKQITTDFETNNIFIQTDTTENNKFTILVVDDEPVTLQVAVNILRLEGYAIATANDGTSAIQALEQNRFDLILLDVMMPGLSGFDVCRLIRKKFSPLELPVLMLTARDRNADFTAGLNAGANDYLLKPFDKNIFIRRINNLLKLKYTTTELNQAINHEQKRIYTDLHDHMGARLTDLQITAKQLVASGQIESDAGKNLEQEIKKTTLLMRERLNELNDHRLLKEDFTEGLRIILLRRYINAGRAFNFQITDDANDFFHKHVTPAFTSELYSIIKEIVTNDLKYGEGESELTIKADEKILTVSFEAQTGYHISTSGS
ncbi:MAG: ATP-binding protein, partial [Gammaproteobacteria bacterium]|nr:ATP-binding protein [Gammaproteobacteria bacterium]